MDIDNGLLIALSLGFLLGLKHATDADHVVAVWTIAREFGSAWRGLWIGVSWGLGHTTPLIVVGIIILVLKESVLERYSQIAPFLEFGVGAMLMILGAQVFWNLRRGDIHIHHHSHNHQEHVHVHMSHPADRTPHRIRNIAHAETRPRSPTFRLKSYLIGIIHGLAGSAAVMLALIPKIDSPWVGISYILSFGLGTIISMALITLAIGAPLALKRNSKTLDVTFAVAAGSASILFGGALMAEFTFGIAIIPL